MNKLRTSISAIALLASVSAFSDVFDDIELQNRIQTQVQNELTERSQQDYYSNQLHENMGTPYIPQEQNDYWSR